jgi:hypothetical protein
MRHVPARRYGWLGLVTPLLVLAMTSGGVGPAANSTAVAAPVEQGGKARFTAWVTLGPEGSVLARAITSDAVCPSLTADARTIPTTVHARPDSSAYPVLVCQAVVPTGARAASVAGLRLALPTGSPRRIVVIGDAGCRLSADDPPQACNDPRAWPFAAVARSAAAWGPDLVIHEGDYIYREAPCPRGVAGCAGSPWGYNWPTWDADFFAPAEPLLRAAPWVFVRGNHELCRRAGFGWFRFLDPRPIPEGGCQDFTEPYAASSGDRRFVVFDVANASDTNTPPDQVAEYRAQFARLGALAGADAWLALHRPLWGIVPRFCDSPIQGTNPTLQAASGNSLPATVRLILAGHIHNFEAVSFADRQPQFVVGNSGTSLDPAIDEPLVGLEVGGAPVTAATTLHRFGYMTLEPSGGDWLATVRDVDGQPMASCPIAGNSVVCSR